jgi:hypothetical protein
MPGQGKYTQFAPLKVDASTKGQASTTRLSKLFNSPPEITSPPDLFKIANAALLATDNGGVQAGDPVQFPGGVSLTYASAPDLAAVKVGGGGLPSTPYTPNLTSPGEKAGANPAGQTDMGVKDIAELNGEAQLNAGGLLNPAKESVSMGMTVTIAADRNPFVMGGHPGGQPLKTVG